MKDKPQPRVPNAEAAPQTGKKRSSTNAHGEKLPPQPQWARGLTLGQGQISHLSVYRGELFREANLAETIKAREGEHPTEAYPIPNPDSAKRIGRRTSVTLEEARDALQAIAQANLRRAREFLEHSDAAVAAERIREEVAQTIETERQKQQQAWEATLTRLFGSYAQLPNIDSTVSSEE